MHAKAGGQVEPLINLLVLMSALSVAAERLANNSNYFNENDQRHPLKSARFHWIIGNDAETAVQSGCTYDRIVLLDGTHGYGFVPNSARVFRYDKEFGISSRALVRAVSDHYPVFAEYRTTGPDDDGPDRRGSRGDHDRPRRR
jgi:hypothetical protein